MSLDIGLNVAMTADGKIAPSSGHYRPFGSPADHAELLRLRSDYDAVMAGATTVNSFPMNLGSGGAKFEKRRLRLGRSAHPLRVVVSGRGHLRLDAEVFNHSSPLLILVSGSVSSSKRRAYEARGAEVWASGGRGIDFEKAFAWMQDRFHLKSLLCEGGGTLNGTLIEKGFVKRCHLTICPLLFGGRTAPSIFDGGRGTRLAEAIQLTEQTRKVRGGELFLTYQLERRIQESQD